MPFPKNNNYPRFTGMTHTPESNAIGMAKDSSFILAEATLYLSVSGTGKKASQGVLAARLKADNLLIHGVPA